MSEEFTLEKAKQALGGCLILCVSFCVLFGGCVAYFSFSGDDSKPKTKRRYEPDELDAFVMSHSFVEDRLKSPGTAKFPYHRDRNVEVRKVHTSQGDVATFRVRAYVDAQNTFGATVRTKYDCIMHAKADKGWTCSKLELLE